jgi:phosphoribosylformylglycinamidine synthase subunit PurQ / glutaminase
VCVITGYGINADEELALAFELAGGVARRVHVNDLIAKPDLLSTFRILAFPGGFSFGDHLGSGKVFATLFRRSLGPALAGFVAAGGLVIGICNGFQVLVKMGVLPNLSGTGGQEVSLIHNDSGKYEDRWVRVSFNPGSPCLWTSGLEQMDLPVRHGEGRFVTASPGLLSELSARGLIALRYAAVSGGEPSYPEDPNGSEGHVAGICDPSGRVFGLMPHPEAFLHPYNHPEWTARSIAAGEGLRIFANGVRAAGELDRTTGGASAIRRA